MDTTALALFFLRTNTSADSGQGRGILQDFGSSQELASLDVLDERRDIDIDRTSFYASRLGTVETTLSLGHSHLLGQSDVHLLSSCGGTIDGIQFWHYHTLNSRTLLGFHALAEFFTPSGIAVGEHFDGVVCGVSIHHHVSGGSRFFTIRLALITSHEVLFVVFELFLFGTLEGSHALEHLVPVDQGTVKLRTVDADELCLATDGQSASTTHARSVDHDGV